MANENKNINELVADDDPTVELESPSFEGDDDVALEADAKTFDSQNESGDDATNVVVSELKSELRSRVKEVGQLQYDVEQLQAKYLGLKTEVGARDTQTTQLNVDLDSQRMIVSRKDKLIKKRDSKIKLLKSEIRQRDDDYRQLQARQDDVLASASESTNDDGTEITDVSSSRREIKASEFQVRLSRSEEYADSLRQQSQDLIESNSRQEREIEGLAHTVDVSHQKIEQLNSELATTNTSLEEINQSLSTIESRHAEEIRTLRFELGEAQETIVETSEVSNQLASDLVDARGFTEALEVKLGDSEEQSSEDLTRLKKEIKKLKSNSEILEQKLATKSEAITVLLEELARKPKGVDADNEQKDAVKNINQGTSGYDVDESHIEQYAPADRMTRVLIGSVDDQVLRFPLFKDRLTIGRTKDNDIQLKAAYVSRRHAVIQTDGDKTRIIDWGSKNGIQVNSEVVDEHFLEHGDVIMIGNAKFRYEELKKREA